MALAFWRDKRATAEKRNGASTSRGDRGTRPDGSDAASQLKVRARRRLVGAAALLLAAVIVVPLVLDPAPRPTSDNIPIDIPSEKQPFTPRLSLPPVPDPGQTPLAPPPDLPAAEPDKAKSDAGASKNAPAKNEATKPDAAKPALPSGESRPTPKEIPPAKPAEAKVKPTSETKVDAKTEVKSAEAAKAKAGRIVLQAAALSTDAAAQDLSERLRKAGFAPFTEKVDTADGVRFRVRVGPYPTRDEAQRAQSKLRALGVSATLVTT